MSIPGELLIGGRVSNGLAFRHADGTAYGRLPVVGGADVVACACGALRNLGFGEREARHALQGISAHVGSNSTVESLVRSALELLTRDSWTKAS